MEWLGNGFGSSMNLRNQHCSTKSAHFEETSVYNKDRSTVLWNMSTH